MSDEPHESGSAEPTPFIVRTAEKATAKPSSPRPQVGEAMFLFFAFIALQIAIGLGLTTLYAGRLEQLDASFLTMVNVVANCIAAVVAAVVMDGTSFRRPLALDGFRWFHLLLAVLLIPPLAAVNIGLAGRLSPLVYPQAKEATEEPPIVEAQNQAFIALTSPSWALMLLLGCVLPAVGEELIFRGLIGRRLVASAGPVVGVLASSLLFALVHYESVQIATTFLLGISLHIVYLAARSLPLAMLVHFLNNAFFFSGFKFYVEHERDVLGVGVLERGVGSLDLFLLAGGTTACLLVLFVRTAPQWQLPGGERWRPGFTTAEMPPAELEARLVQRAPGVFLTIVVGLFYFAFAARWGTIWLYEAGQV